MMEIKPLPVSIISYKQNLEVSAAMHALRNTAQCMVNLAALAEEPRMIERARLLITQVNALGLLILKERP